MLRPELSGCCEYFAGAFLTLYTCSLLNILS
jgi:hypothetical protein